MRRGGAVLKHRITKPVVFTALLIPFAWSAWYIYQAYLGHHTPLGANPIEAFIRFNGDWAMRILLITLAVTPFAKFGKMPDLYRFRRMVGLFAFFYGFVHIMGYVGLDQVFYWAAIWDDILKRNFITVGAIAFLLMTPLAITSTKGMMRRLGGKRWRALHRLIYPAAVLVIVHYYMMIKADPIEPVIYGIILAVLLAARRVNLHRRRHDDDATAAPAT